jgi:hypothetical protein
MTAVSIRKFGNFFYHNLILECDPSVGQQSLRNLSDETGDFMWTDTLRLRSRIACLTSQSGLERTFKESEKITSTLWNDNRRVGVKTEQK